MNNIPLVEQLYIKAYNDGMSIKQIVKTYTHHLPEDEIRKILQKHKVIKNKWTEDEIDKLRDLFKTHTAKECANILNKTFYSVRYMLEKHKIYKYKKIEEEENQNIFLTPDPNPIAFSGKRYSELTLEERVEYSYRKSFPGLF